MRARRSPSARRPRMLAVVLSLALAAPPSAEPRPNVLLILTDDQAYGDFSGRGNPIVRTPALDRLASESAELAQFYVSPICTPTRASLMTGRYHLRSAGVTLLHPDERTLAEMFAANAYRTAIFGKWNLGDNVPSRAIDQGFHEALVNRGASINRLTGPPSGASYFDPVLWHDGRPERQSGYVTDVLTDRAMEFIARASDQPFFVYLAYNAPHEPLEVPAEYLAPYAALELSRDDFPAVGRPLPEALPVASTQRLYAMLENLDDNVARLLAQLELLGIADDTLVVFLSDNGPAHVRWNAGLRGLKGSVHEGGTRVPCWLRWPGRIAPGQRIDTPAAHVDLAPTLLEAARIPPPYGVRFDGASLWPLLQGGAPGRALDERALFLQWHIGDAPEAWRACAVRTREFKLVQAVGVGAADLAGRRRLELFEIGADPFEERDVAALYPEVVRDLCARYDAWFADVESTRCFELPRIALGAPGENPTALTRIDLRSFGPGAHWRVDVVDSGPYAVTLWFEPRPEERRAALRLGGLEREVALPGGVERIGLEGLALPLGPGELSILVDGERPLPPLWVEFAR